MKTRVFALVVVLALVTPGPATAGDQARFAFHSSPCINLHHFLYHAARNGLRGEERLQGRVRIEAVDADVELGVERAEAWRRALEIYAEYAERDLLFAGVMTRVKRDCAAGFDALPAGPEAESLYDALRLAMPVYRAHWWPRHDAANGQRINELAGYLDEYGESMAERLAADYDSHWGDEPIRVDVSYYANWAGAYTTHHPNHVVLASSPERHPGLVGLEILFHEAGHTEPLGRNIGPFSREAAREAGVDEDRVWHSYIFYATGRVAAEHFPEGYEPYAARYGLWARGAMEAHLALIEEAYDTERSLAEEFEKIHRARGKLAEAGD